MYERPQQARVEPGAMLNHYRASSRVVAWRIGQEDCKKIIVLSMSNFADSYVGQLRALVGHRILLMPGARIVIEQDDGKI